MKLIIIRHGETEENKIKTIQEHLPGKLSDEGKNKSNEKNTTTSATRSKSKPKNSRKSTASRK